MGLDMYLSAKRFLWYNEDELVNKLTSNFPELGEAKVKRIEAEIGYWRKANQIHKWFVDNVQEGEDDCGDYEVSKEQLKELLDLIDQVLADKSQAPNLLPNTNGFFFGSQDYDEYYFQDLEYTKKLIEGVLSNEELSKHWCLEYTSSW